MSDVLPHYNRLLLTVPLAPMQDHLDGYADVLEWVKKRIRKKVRPQDVGKLRKIEQLIKEWESLYERAKVCRALVE